METPSSFQTSIKYLNFRAKIFQLLDPQTFWTLRVFEPMSEKQPILPTAICFQIRLGDLKEVECLCKTNYEWQQPSEFHVSVIQIFLFHDSRLAFLLLQILPQCRRIYRIQSQEQTQGATNHQHKAPKLKPKPIEDQINFQHLMMVAHIFYPKRIL